VSSAARQIRGNLRARRAVIQRITAGPGSA
jgi:hypothetical protein